MNVHTNVRSRKYCTCSTDQQLSMDVGGGTQFNSRVLEGLKWLVIVFHDTGGRLEQLIGTYLLPREPGIGRPCQVGTFCRSLIVPGKPDKMVNHMVYANMPHVCF